MPRKPKKRKILVLKFDENPEYRGIINFASNGVKNKQDAFNYGFKLGWQTCWREWKRFYE